MDLTLFAPKSPSLSAVEYLKAKLDYEATPYGLHSIMESEPQQVFVVDVRDRAAFEKEHIYGATNIPSGEIISRLSSLPKDRTIVTYCWDMTCAMAPKAALELAQKGFKVQFLAGGIEEWKRKGYTVAQAR